MKTLERQKSRLAPATSNKDVSNADFEGSSGNSRRSNQRKTLMKMVSHKENNVSLRETSGSLKMRRHSVDAGRISISSYDSPSFADRRVRTDSNSSNDTPSTNSRPDTLRRPNNRETNSNNYGSKEHSPLSPQLRIRREKSVHSSPLKSQNEMIGNDLEGMLSRIRSISEHNHTPRTGRRPTFSTDVGDLILHGARQASLARGSNDGSAAEESPRLSLMNVKNLRKESDLPNLRDSMTRSNSQNVLEGFLVEEFDHRAFASNICRESKNYLSVVSAELKEIRRISSEEMQKTFREHYSVFLR